MESIEGHDAWKTTIPTQDDIDEMEIKLLERNIADCPFCLGRPYFDDSASSELVYVSCDCGAQMRGDDWHDVSAKWNVRTRVARNVVREGYRTPSTMW